MMEGRERELIEYAKRAVTALEKLAEDPIVEMEVGPPVCPHCGILNPVVEIPASDGGKGHLWEFYVPFVCTECSKEFLAVPMQWSMHRDDVTLRMEIEGREQERAEAQNGGANQRENQTA